MNTVVAIAAGYALGVLSCSLLDWIREWRSRHSGVRITRLRERNLRRAIREASENSCERIRRAQGREVQR